MSLSLFWDDSWRSTADARGGELHDIARLRPVSDTDPSHISGPCVECLPSLVQIQRAVVGARNASPSAAHMVDRRFDDVRRDVQVFGYASGKGAAKVGQGLGARVQVQLRPPHPADFLPTLCDRQDRLLRESRTPRMARH